MLKWSEDPVRLSSEVKMPQFKVENVIAEKCDDSAVIGSKQQSTLFFKIIETKSKTVFISFIAQPSQNPTLGCLNFKNKP